MLAMDTVSQHLARTYFALSHRYPNGRNGGQCCRADEVSFHDHCKREVLIMVLFSASDMIGITAAGRAGSGNFDSAIGGISAQ